MPQETNLNVAPYFDDFDPQSNYYSVLFKPAYPVQARELNNLQSILQNQIEQFGNHIFKEGAKVIPGQTTYLDEFSAIQIEETFLGVPVSIYLDQLLGKTIKGATSNVTAKVITYITNEQSDKENYTLYVNYFDSSTTDEETGEFLSDEVLNVTEPIQFATTFIGSGEGFAKTLTQNAAATGSAFAISNGVYFIRGHFVNVYDEILILDQYTNTPSYRIGFNVREEIISSDIDQSLNDNAQGFTNYTAPGADRFKITQNLAKKDLDDFEDANFIQLAEVQNGILRISNNATEYNYLGEEMAKRTFEESGNYYVKEFITSMKESLNDQVGNRGIYTEDQKTRDGNTPSDDLAIYKVAAGKAYVKGHEVETFGPTYVDVNKPRTTKLAESQGINFGFGPTFGVNRVYGSPSVGVDNTNVLSLRDQRVGNDQSVAAGKEIGICRVYDFALESGSYNTTNPDTNEWDLSLFDVQTYTEFELSDSITLETPTYIVGDSSGSTAFLRHSVVGTGFTAYEVKGEFLLGERLTFTGATEGGMTVIGLTNFETTDIRSVHGVVGSAGTFTADLIQKERENIGIASISAESGGISVVTSPSTTFSGIASVGNIVEYSVATNDLPSLARVTENNSSNIKIEAVSNVPGYRIGTLPTSGTQVTDFKLLESQMSIPSYNGNLSDGRSIYSRFPRLNVESVDTSSSSLNIRRSFTVNIINGATGSVNTNANEVFQAFDEERYTLVRSDGSTEALTEDKFNFSDGNSTLIIKGLGSNDTGANLVTTITKNKINSKIKQYSVSDTIIIDKSSKSGSGVGSTTFDDGLQYGNFPYGTRVQDSEISLNVPDCGYVYAIYQSEDNNDPVIPNLTTASLDGPTATTNDLIVGDRVIGQISGAIAMYFKKKSDTSIEFIYSNDKFFISGEVIKFVNSDISAVAFDIDSGDKNIDQDFFFINNQKNTFYDISKIRRRSTASVPNRKLRVCFTSSSYDPSDDGDITTVESYKNMPYRRIPRVGNIRCSDIIDARPRVSQYVVGQGNRSPFEFYGRSFNGGQHSAKDVIASDETIVLDYSYYLPRFDSIYLTEDGDFIVKQGVPADDPSFPDSVSGAMSIANVRLPSYLFDVSEAEISFVEHKRYQMSDISKLEQRIANLEYYSALNSLEQSTLNQFVADSNGLDRFKSGIFVDNFSTPNVQNNDIGVKNSVDKQRGFCRPSHYTTAFNLEVGNTSIDGIGENSNQDKKFADLLGTNVKKGGAGLSLDYTETVWLKQQFATRVESVTPYMVKFWSGKIKLNPDSDVWVDVTQMEERVVVQDNFSREARNRGAAVTGTVGNRSGIAPVRWGAWQSTGPTTTSSSSTNVGSATISSAPSQTRVTGDWERRTDQDHGRQFVRTTQTITNETSTQQVSTETTTSTPQTRSGTQVSIRESVENLSFGEFLVGRDIINFMRARNIECISTSMKPFTRLYAFFDDVNITNFCSPKLLEIEMSNGTFQVGERVRGVMPTSEQNEDTNPDSVPNIAFRVATQNHKYGPFNDPTDRYSSNPYNRDTTIGPEYSETSTLINIDTSSLEDEDQPDFAGWVSEGMILRGESSGAEATVKFPRLITDNLGTMIYAFQVPPSGNAANPTFETGQSRMRLTSSGSDSRISGTFTTSSEVTFYSEGQIDTTQELTLSVRHAEITTNTRTEDRVNSSTSTSSGAVSTVSETGRSSTSQVIGYTDPLAQSFFVDDTTGVFITSIDVYFQAKPLIDRTPVTCQLRTVELGTPTGTILPFSSVDVDPETITTSENASVPTNIQFEAPVYLNPLKEYAVVLLSHNTEYTVYISQLGEPDISTLGSEEGQILVSTQPTLGSLFKSQNASTWTPSQYEDLTYTLYRAEFATSGSVQFFNPNVPKTLERLDKDKVKMKSREIRVATSSTVTSTIEAGNTISQTNSGATGNFVEFSGPASGSMSITRPGVGYTGSNYTFTGIALTSMTGTGINAQASITISNGGATSATVTNGGAGYKVGDILRPITIGNDGLGSGMKLAVSTLSGNNEMILTGVQGKFTTNAVDVLNFTNSLGSTAAINGGSLYIESPIRVTSDGNFMDVEFLNHGMHSLVNIVELSDLTGDVRSTILTSDYSSTETGSIGIGNTVDFTLFENLLVQATNPGYVKIGDEIISYTGFSGNTITGITRGIDNTLVQNHKENDIVKKYEMNGVSLRRINTQHSLNTITDDTLVTLDSYPIKIDMSDTTRGTDRTGDVSLPELFFNETKSGGGVNGRSSYNVQFESCVPQFTYITPTGTSIEGTMRTIGGTSISGNEPSFSDKGFVPITFNDENYFDSPRIVASKVNENTYLSDFPANKSLTVNVNMFSGDSRISPMLNLERSKVIFITNRVNSVVDNYANDPRVNTFSEDPSSFMYVTRSMSLENPATSIQLLMDAYMNEQSDIRAFYAYDQNLPLEEIVFIPFPGFVNQDPSRPNTILDPQLSDGTTDVFTARTDEVSSVPSLGSFKELKFSVDLLPQFTSLIIKVVGTSTNQAAPPQIANLRLMALA